MKMSRKLIIFILVLMLVFSFSLISINKEQSKSNYQVGTKLNADTWHSNLNEVVSLTDNTGKKYLDISNFYTVQGYSYNVVDPRPLVDENTIIKINNGLDLYYFGELCNNDVYKQYYLSYHYVLGNDIDYTDASTTYKLMKPVGWGANTFSGIFDGQGFTINDLFIYKIDDNDDFEENFFNSDQDYLEHLSLFSENTGTIKNLGIINSNNIQISDLYNTSYGEYYFITSSIVVGNNRGVVDHVYVQDLRGDASGITVEGGYTASSSFIGINSGTISNCYVACNYITSTSVIMSGHEMRYPFVVNNTGTITNSYYDNSIIYHDNYNHYLSELGITSSMFQDLTKFSNDDGWYTNKTYQTETGTNTYGSFLRLTYPVLLGFDIREINGVKYFEINTAAKLVYFSKVLKYSAFRTSKYAITKTCDMAEVASDAYFLTNDIFSGVIDGSICDDVNSLKVNLANGSNNNYSSIINFNVESGVSYTGYHNYGLFGILSGTIRKLNIYNAHIKPVDLKNNNANFNETTNFGLVCGYLQNGTIDDVHVNGTIELSNTSVSNYIGTSNSGGLVGYCEGGTIKNSTSSGKIIGSVQSITSNYQNITIGGLIGRNNYANELADNLSSMQIEAIKYTTSNDFKQYIGGCIGYTLSQNVYRLQNNGNIYIGEPLTNYPYYYGKVYVGGIFGLVGNALKTNGEYFNNGDLYFYANDNNSRCYLSGVMNIMSMVAEPYNAYTTNDSVTTISNKVNSLDNFAFTSVSNAGTLHIENYLSRSYETAKLFNDFANTGNKILDIRCAGIAYSYLTNVDFVGLYNLDYYYQTTYKCTNSFTYNGTTYNVGRIITKEELLMLPNEHKAKFSFDAKNKVANGSQEIDISMIDEYAPLVHADNFVTRLGNKLYIETNQVIPKSGTFHLNDPVVNSYIDINRAYNYRDVSYVTDKEPLFYSLQLSGGLNGRNFNINNLRNDGNIDVFFSKVTTTTTTDKYQSYYGDDKKLKVYGCFEEVSIGCRAKNVYNGGNITISSGATNSTNLMVVFSIYVGGLCYKNIGNDNPGDNLMLPSGYEGSLHNSINNGEIRVKSVNSNTGYFYGQSRIGGICAFNASTISSCFNLGDIYNINHTYAVNFNYGTYGDEWEVETGGFCFIMCNQTLGNNTYTKANIIDSANNGTIISATSSAERPWVNASGFVVRNERSESGDLITTQGEYNKNPNEQKIEYCINYGDVYAYNARTSNPATTSTEPDCKAAGFVCLGICSVIDVVNYGNVYSSKVAAGMFGHLFFSRFLSGSNIENSPVYIANAINYGDIGLFNSNQTNLNYLMSGNHKQITKIPYNQANPAGALIGILAPNNNADNRASVIYSTVNIKNLINFREDVNIVGRVPNFYNTYNAADYNAIVNNLQYMATVKPKDESPRPFGNGTGGSWTNGNNYLGIKSYYLDDRDALPNITNKLSQDANGGIFNPNYTLRNAPALLDVNGNVVDDISLADPNNTDNFIADYIQFVPFSKVNDYLLDKINLSSNTYELAFNKLINNADMLDQVLIKYLNNSDDATINTIYNAILAHNRYQTAQTNLFNNNEYLLELTSKLYDNHPDDQQLFNAMMSIINNTNDLNSIFGTSDNLYNLIMRILNRVPDNHQVIQELFDIILNNDTYLDLFIEYSSYNFTDVENNYLASLNDSQVNAYFNQILTHENISNMLNDEAYLNNHETFLTGLLEGVDDATIQSLAQGLSSNATIDFISEYVNTLTKEEKLQIIKNFFTNNLNVTSLNQNKNNYSFNTDEQKTLLLNYFNTSTNFNVANAINDLQLSDEQLYLIFDYMTYDLLDLANTLAHNIAINNYLYIRSTEYTYNARNSDYIEGQGLNINTVTQGQWNENVGVGASDYSGKYDESGNVYRPNNNNAQIRYFYGWNTGSRQNPIYRWNNNQLQYSTSWFNSGYRLDTTTTNSYTYFTANGNNYTPVGYGKYVRFGDGTSTFDFFTPGLIQTAPQADSVALYKKMINNANNLNITEKRELITYFINNSDADNISKLFNSISFSSNNYSNFFTQLTNTTSLTSNDLSNIILDLCNDNSLCMTYFNQFYTDTNKIISKARIDATYYYNLLNTIYDTLDPFEKRTYLSYTIKYETFFRRDAYRSLLNTYDATNKKQTISFISSLDKTYLSTVFNQLNTNNLLAKNEFMSIISLMLQTNPRLFNNLRDSITLNTSDKRDLIIAYTHHDYELYKYILQRYFNVNLDGVTDHETFLKNLEENLGIDSTLFTDFFGIYALASSHGIKNGMFIPDNIDLISIDPYELVDGVYVNDPTWRGGTLEAPNYFSLSDTTCVNYKVYHTMKQLKKSISTVVFRIELVENNDHQVNNQYVVTNDLDKDYDLNNYEIHFYIPSNGDELKQDYLYINTRDGSYELAYLAQFKTLPSIFIDGSNITYPVGSIIESQFVVQAEDVNVTRTYKIIIHVTALKSVNELSSIIINNNDTLTENTHYRKLDNSAFFTYGNNNEKFITGDEVNPEGRLIVNYNTYNIQGGTNMLKDVKLYRYQDNVPYPTSASDLTSDRLTILEEHYKFNDTDHNGIVQIEDGAELYLGEGPFNGAWVINQNGTLRQAVGRLSFDIVFDDELSAGTYVFEFTINEDTKYYVVFRKNLNLYANVLAITYGEFSYTNVLTNQTFANSNQGYELPIRYNEYFTESILSNIGNATKNLETNMYEVTLENGVNLALSLSSRVRGFVINSITHSLGADQLITYHVSIRITSESGNTNDFTILFKEQPVNGQIISSFEDGRIITDNDLTNGNVFDYDFDKYNTPSYLIDYDMSNVYFEQGKQFMKIELVNHQELIASLSERQLNALDEATFGSDYVNIKTSLTDDEIFNLRKNTINEICFVLNVNEGYGYSIDFLSDAFSGTYVFDVYYANQTTFKENDVINWHHSLGSIRLVKNKNTDSYLTNISFVSETVVTALDTIVSPSKLAIFEDPNNNNIPGFANYEYLVANPIQRPITSLPSKIFYNDYAQDINKQANMYIIGLVDRTSIDEYSPIFGLPLDSEIYLMSDIEGTLYKHVLYEAFNESNQQVYQVFLISENNTIAYDENKVLLTNNLTDTITYNGLTFRKSRLAGEASTFNLGLLYDFTIMSEESVVEGIKEDFNYAKYRVYSENYNPLAPDPLMYTDFNISVQDISYNVYINVAIKLADDMTQADKALFESSAYDNYLFLILSNFQESVVGSNQYDTLTNMIGTFVNYEVVDNNHIFSIPDYRTNTSGKYQIEFSLPDDFTFTFTATKRGVPLSQVDETSLIVETSITSQIINIEIVIHKLPSQIDEWGQHFEDILTPFND